MVKSADRILHIMNLIGSTKEGMKHAEIARKLNIPKGSLSFLLSDLVSEKFLTLSDEGRYRIGSQLLILARHYLSGLDIIKSGESLLKTITESTNESAGLAIPKGDEVVIVAKSNASQYLKIEFEIGQSYPLHSSAAGKAVLAFMDDGEIDKYISEDRLVQVTPNTITDPDKLREEISSIRKKKISYSFEEQIQGRIAIAAPIFKNGGEIMASVVQAVPAIRFTKDKEESIKKALASASQKLSAAFGYKR